MGLHCVLSLRGSVDCPAPFGTWNLDGIGIYFFVCKKVCITLHGKPISELQDVTCHVGSHGVTCHPTQVNAPRFKPNQ